MLLYFFLTNHTFSLYHTIHMWSRFLWAFVVYSYFIIHNKFAKKTMTPPLLLFILGTSHLSMTLFLLPYHWMSPRSWEHLAYIRWESLGVSTRPPGTLMLPLPVFPKLFRWKCIHGTGSWSLKSCNLLTATWLSLPFSPSLPAPGWKYLSSAWTWGIPPQILGKVHAAELGKILHFLVRGLGKSNVRIVQIYKLADFKLDHQIFKLGILELEAPYPGPQHLSPTPKLGHSHREIASQLSHSWGGQLMMSATSW